MKNTSLSLFFSLVICSLLSISLCDIPACDSRDQAVLLKVKSQFGASGTKILSDWDPNGNCCDYSFVGCRGDEQSNPGRVNAVTVGGGSGLVGQIPDALSQLPFLEEVMFFDEPKLVGPIPQSFSKLKNLQIIFLNSNSLSGRIPGFLGQLKNLQQIDISDNKFTGSIPPSLSQLSQLSQFNVSHNMLTGGIPKLQTKSLKGFDVSSNQLCGAIPSGLNKFAVSSFQNNKCLCGAPLPACK